MVVADVVAFEVGEVVSPTMLSAITMAMAVVVVLMQLMLLPPVKMTARTRGS